MRKKLALLLTVGLLISSCAAPTVYLKNSETGEIAACVDSGVAPIEYQLQCIDDYKEQGWERVPHK